MLAAVRACELRLGFARHRADHAGAERPGPLAEQQAHAAGRGVHQDRVAGPDTVRAVQEVLGGHALQHDRPG